MARPVVDPPRTIEVGHVSYLVEPVELLDENLRTCVKAHRDALLDARFLLYGPPAA